MTHPISEGRETKRNKKQATRIRVRISTDALDLGVEVRDRLERGGREAGERAEPLAQRGCGHGAFRRRERLVHFHAAVLLS